MVRIYLTCIILAFFFGISFSQSTITGIVVDETTNLPLEGVLVSTSLPDQTTTDAEGKFSVKHVAGTDILIYLDWNGETSEFNTKVSSSPTIDLGQIVIRPVTDPNEEREFPTIILDDEDDDANISGLLQSGDDLFGRETNYTFSPAGFLRRGMESEYGEGYLNYIPVNDLESGGVYYSNWGGLNDVMKQDAEMIGAEQAEWSFGGVSSTFNTDLRAISQWKQKKISYAVTNRNYRNRIMGTWSTGLMPSGWALSLSGSRRWSHEGFIPGTFYDGWSYFASVGRVINEKHSLNLSILGSPYKRGGSSTSVQEMYDLSDDHYYNSYWGYQEGEKRNGRVYSGHIPLVTLRHDWTLNEKWSVTTALGYQFGENSTGSIDWLNANDPRPDYYRRLPSYIDDPALSAQMTELLSSDESLRQIQWNQLYEVNLNSEYTVEDVDGIEGNSHTGALSKYVTEERHNDLDRKSGNIVLQFLPKDNMQVLLGVNVTIQNTHNFKELSDLLGGEFYLDWDKFAAQDFPGNDDALQNDLRRPNRLVHVGDQFGYDYYSRIRQQTAWMSYKLDSRKWEVSVAGAIKNNIYWREGLTQNGKFPDNSYGESEKYDFLLPSAKGVLRYKFDGRNYLTISGMISEKAPTFRNAFVSPRTRDNVVSGLENENIKLGEARYDFKSPYLKISIAGYYQTIENAIESTSFYHDDLRTFVNFTLTDIDKEHTGIEAAAEYTLVLGFHIHGAASIGRYIYTSRPNATITQDNDGSLLVENITVYARNLYVSGTPQTAYTAGLTYESKKFWKLYLNVNRFEDNWINFNPIRRTTTAVDLVEPGSDQWNSILAQEKVDPAWTVDVSFYKSWRVNWPHSETTYALNIGITNLLNNTDFISNGFEQYRFDNENKDVTTFPNKYSYMQGLNYFVQGSMKF